MSIPPTETKRPVFASEWGDRGGISAYTAQWATGSRMIEAIATLTMSTDYAYQPWNDQATLCISRSISSSEIGLFGA